MIKIGTNTVGGEACFYGVSKAPIPRGPGWGPTPSVPYFGTLIRPKWFDREAWILV